MKPKSTNVIPIAVDEKKFNIPYGTSIWCVSRQNSSVKGDPQARHKCWFDYHDGKITSFDKSFSLVEMDREVTGKAMMETTSSGQPLSIIKIDHGATCSVRMGAQAGIMKCEKRTL